MKPLEKIIRMAQARPGRIALSEAEDPRVVEGALRAARDGIAHVTLVGRRDAVESHLRQEGGARRAVNIEDPATSERTSAYAAAYHELRRSKGVDRAKALSMIEQSLGFAAMMVRQGDADGSVGGAMAATADTVRTALQIIGLRPGSRLASSFFLIMLCEPHHPRKGAFLFADCGLVVEPDTAELAEIALATAVSCEALLGEPAKVAMLSFSTGGSAAHARVTKVVEATRLVHMVAPGLAVDGEIQFDAAFVEAIGKSKAPHSVIGGMANVFIFPNLEAANIGYKIAQRIGGAQAIGPILQGLAKPANDLSRGCSADDVYHAIAITAVQAGRLVQR
ncbi:MAG: phosphate acetyltransferase [Xanthobacteraceae bacterium]